MPEQNETRREIAEAFVEKWPIFASPVDAVELLLKCRDERAAKIVNDARFEGESDLRSLAHRIRDENYHT